jgi:tetratricopeptide (TPR) repeat protein
MPDAAGRWFYAQGEKRLGPVALEWLSEKVASGELPPSTLIWRHGMKEWTAAETVADVAEHLPPPLPGGNAAPKPAAKPAAPSPVSKPKAPAPPDSPRVAELRQRLADGANWRAFPQLADELRKEKRLDEAMAVVQDGLKKHPDYRLARITLANVQMDRGELEAARGELQGVLQSAPENVVAGRLLGDCFERMGDERAALLTYKATLVFAPRDPMLLARLSALGEAAAEDEPAASAEEPAAPDSEAAETEPGLEGLADLAAEGNGVVEKTGPIPLVPADEEFELERPGDVVRVVKSVTATPAQLAFTSEDPSYWPTRSLAENDFPDLVQTLHERRWSGTLSLTHMGQVKSVVVQKGRLVFASSSSRDDRLGELLLRRGRITVRQYAEASAAIGKGKRLGAALVEQGALDAADLVKVVVEHTQEVIYSVFPWTEGFYRMKEGSPGEEAITLKMSTPDLILEGIGRIDSWSRVERGVGGLDARYERSEDWEKELKQMTLSSEKLALLTEHTSPRSVAEICETSAMLSDFEVCRTIWAFRVIGVLRAIPPALA